MRTALDTASIRPADRFAWWREVVCRSFVHLDVEPAERADAF